MTKAEWLRCNDLQAMMELLQGNLSDRKWRLFACACCRHIWSFMPDERARKAVEVAERLADGMATNVERREAAIAAMAIEQGRGGAAATSLSVIASRAAGRASQNATYLFGTATLAPFFKAGGVSNPSYRPALIKEMSKERVAQTHLLRDIVYNPFQLVTIDSAWLAWNDGAVVQIAQGIYDERAFDRLPILADALIDAGCDNDDILNHCRQSGDHVRGCWVVDLLLGRT